MRNRKLPVRRASNMIKVWGLVGAAVLLALGLAAAVFANVPASPPTPQAIPLPQPLPLKNVPIPEPPDLDVYVSNRQAAIELGKALFWDMQVGSDGQMACASCHFHAGVDSRSSNTVHPGPDGDFEAAPINSNVVAGDFPYHERINPDFQSAVTKDWDDITGSQGVRGREFVDIVPGQAVETTTAATEAIFNLNGTPIRRVTARNAPTVINAVFNFDNLWDGSANNIFNGVNPHGPSDAASKVFVETSTGLQAETVRIRNASLASQAVGPPMNPNEMSAAGRTFPKLGKKMLSLTPLADQEVSQTDSVLGGLAHPTKGLTISYEQMIQDAFQQEWWSNTTDMVTYDENGVPTISPRPDGPLTTDQFTQMEANFSLFFGLSIQLYESTLVSDQSPFDQVMEGTRAFSQQEEQGFALVIGECGICHAGSEFTTATHTNVNFGQGGPLPLVELMLKADFTQAIYDDGYFNIGVTRTTDDISRGADDPFGSPLAYSWLGRQKQLGTLPAHYEPFVRELPANALGDLPVTVNGAFKAPTLRNIELTGPYFHNGGVATLDQLLQFYTRGGNHPVENAADLDPQMLPIVQLQAHPELQASMIAFLHTLTDERVRYERAPFDHPELFVPVRANPGVPSTDEMMTIPAVGEAGRATPIQPFMESNNEPVAIDDAFTVPFESAGVYLNVLFNDGDLDGQPIHVSAVDAVSALGGTLTIGEEGATVVYTAPALLEGNDTFDYTITDGTLTKSATVNITIQAKGTNRKPEALFDLFPVGPINGKNVAFPVMLNDQDLDGNPIFIVSVTDSPNGTSKIDPVRDQILFTPNPGFYGHTTISYTISDGDDTATAEAMLKINDWPLGLDDTYTVRAESVNNRLFLLANDKDKNPDDIITILGYDALLKGSALIDPTGTYMTYTPYPGETGTERFKYYVGDAIVADWATVTINITPNNVPVVLADNFRVLSGSANNALDVLANDSDADNDVLKIVTVTDPSNGQVTIVNSKTLRYTPEPGFFGTDTFYYTVNDGYKGIRVAKVTVTVALPYSFFAPFLAVP